MVVMKVRTGSKRTYECGESDKETRHCWKSKTFKTQGLSVDRKFRLESIMEETPISN